MESDRFDELDRQIAHALFVDGRASFSLIGAVLGASDKTVARRYERMRAEGALRVIAHSHMEMLGQSVWFLRIGCGPGASIPIADALARRPDTTWVTLISGGTEVTCAAQNDTDEKSTALMMTKLPHTPRVESITAQRLLHAFAIEEISFIAKHGPLSADQITALRAGVPAPTGRVPLSSFDHRLRAQLIIDGRMDFERLAKECGSSPSTVRRRVGELRECGVLNFGIELDWRMFGLCTRAGLWLDVEPARLDDIGKELAGHREISSVSATTGATNLIASVVVPDDRALYDYLSGVIGSLAGVTRYESAPVVRILKQRRYAA
ncbi:Lrp/AsnC family transcriptional regulator [Nocardia jejuensis]|uniref:Lrp/AsnC family transcriptional regulator n=1 Tax=Nocardia jejuensis TaxID=328049 RepID=UPI00082FDFE7|nr:AsnC family transcriptional regulator [Nocardia jejuensis]